jgi:hypothetical protein
VGRGITQGFDEFVKSLGWHTSAPADRDRPDSLLREKHIPLAS